jgi:PKD repeat protein
MTIYLPDGTIVKYDWDFGDGHTGTGVKPTHTYTAPGKYNVTLTVTDDMGVTDSTTRTATIIEPVTGPSSRHARQR